MTATKQTERDSPATIFDVELYKKLVRQRKENGLPPLEVMPGLDRATVSRIRRSLRVPGVDKAILLASTLGVQVEDLWKKAA